MEQQELLNQSYQQLKQTLSSNGNFKINRKIGYKSQRLKYEYGLEDDEILNAIFCHCCPVYFFQNSITACNRYK